MSVVDLTVAAARRGSNFCDARKAKPAVRTVSFDPGSASNRCGWCALSSVQAPWVGVFSGVGGVPTSLQVGVADVSAVGARDGPAVGVRGGWPRCPELPTTNCRAVSPSSLSPLTQWRTSRRAATTTRRDPNCGDDAGRLRRRFFAQRPPRHLLLQVALVQPYFCLFVGTVELLDRAGSHAAGRRKEGSRRAPRSRTESSGAAERSLAGPG